MELDEETLRLLEELVRRPRATYKEIASTMKRDQRTIARRTQELEETGVLRPSVEVDWKSLGMEVVAFVGLTTARTPRTSALLQDYLLNDPRIVEAYETVGSNQFFARVLGQDITSIRESVLRDLDPLAGDIATSLVAREIKPRDYFSLLRHIREVKFPKSRAVSQEQAGPSEP